MKTINVSKVRKKESLLFLLLAHHRSDQLHRTIHLRLGQRDLYLCARGTGRYSGLLTTVILGNFLQIPLWFYYFSFIIFPIPATIDWTTQKIGWRESRNVIRVPTGFLLGIGNGLHILSFFKGLTSIYTFGIVVLLVFFSCMCVAKYLKRRMS